MNKPFALKKYWNIPVITVAILAVSIGQLSSCKPKNNNSSQSDSTQTTNVNPLATPAQLHADSLTVKLLNDTAIQNAEAEVYKVFAADSVSKASPEGLVAAKQALHEIVTLQIQYAIANTPAHPDFLWFCRAPRSWYGVTLPGSRVIFDNPDNVYRIAYVDSASHYEIHVHHNDKAPIQESFELLSTTIPSTQLGFIEGKNIKLDSNGDYTVTVSPDTSSAIPNHLRVTKSLGFILYRNSLSNWNEQTPTSIDIKRIGDADTTPPKTDSELVATVVKGIKTQAFFFNKLKNAWLYATTHPNVLGKPFVRDGGWGFALSGQYNLANDEAWVIKLNPEGAKYIGFQLADPWLVSLDYIQHQTSLKNTQAVADKDGNYTYVISATDPGINNWLDDRGDAHGSLLIRWQAFDNIPKSIDDAIISQKIIKLSDITQDSSFNYQKITTAQRDTIIKARIDSYSRRIN